MSWPLPQLVVNISPLEIVFSVFQICVFSGGGRESPSGEWLSLRRPVCDLTGARLSRMALNTATTQTQTQLYNYVEKYGNKDLSIRSTGFAALGLALLKQACAHSQKSVVPNCPSCLQVFTYQQLSTYSQETNVVNQRLSCLRLFSSCYKALICC